MKAAAEHADVQGEESREREVSQRRAGAADGDLQQTVAHPAAGSVRKPVRVFVDGVAVLVPREQVAGQHGRQRARAPVPRWPKTPTRAARDTRR